MTTTRRDRVRVRSGVRRSAIVASVACAIAAVRQIWVADAPSALTLGNVVSIALTVAVVAIPMVVALGHDGLGRARMVGVPTIAVAAVTLTTLTAGLDELDCCMQPTLGRNSGSVARTSAKLPSPVPQVHPRRH